MAGLFNLGSFSGEVPSYGASSLDMQGLADRLNRAGIAGRYGYDKEAKKQYDDIFGDPQMGGIAYMLDRRAAYESDPQRMKEKLDIALPFYKALGDQQMKYGLQSTLLGAGLSAIKSIPETINAFRAIPLQGLYNQANNLGTTFSQYGSGRPGFSGIRTRLGVS